MPNKIDDQLLNNISALAQLGNTIEQAAVVLEMSAADFVKLLSDNKEVRQRWEKGGIEAINQLKVALTRQAIAGSVQAGHLLLKMRGEMEPKKSAPLASVSPSTPTTERRGAAWRLKKIADAALELQVSPSFIRNAIRDASNPLPVEKRNGDWCVKPGELYDWICKHAKRRPPNLKEPIGYTEPKENVRTPAAATEAGESEDVDVDLDVERILKEVYRDDEASAAKAGKRLGVAREVRLLVESKLKREKMLPIADVVKVIRSFGALLVEEIEANVDAQAADVIKVVRERLDVDLTENPAAHAILKSAFCEQAAKGLIPAIHRRVQDEVDGVQVLQLESEL